MSDLIERLRGFLAAYRQCRGDGEMHSFYGGGLNGELHTRDLQEAADQLEAQQAEIARLRRGLENAWICLGRIRIDRNYEIAAEGHDKARAALEQKP